MYGHNLAGAHANNPQTRTTERNTEHTSNRANKVIYPTSSLFMCLHVVCVFVYRARARFAHKITGACLRILFARDADVI